MSGATFSVDEVVDLLKQTMKSGSWPRKDAIKRLTRELTFIAQTWEFSRKRAAAAAQGQAERVSSALMVLQAFFDNRRAEAAESANPSVVACEAARGDEFDRFLAAVMSQPFDLDMDAALYMRDLNKWHDIVGYIATAFRNATLKDDFRLSENGPVVRFAAAVISRITGETPRAGAIKMYLSRGTNSN